MNSIRGGKGNRVENQTENGLALAESIKNFGKSLADFSTTIKQCRADGMTDLDIRDAILSAMPEEERPAFMQQWPYFSMMLNLL